MLVRNNFSQKRSARIKLSYMRNFFLRHFPLFIITIFIALIAALNYTAGTFLTGGDNLHPEFNFALNIQRSIFSVWQEYQGVGLLGGMGHAADILRQLFLLPFSYIMQTDQIRWFWTFLTLFIGTAGSFYLIRRLIKHYWINDLFKIDLIALAGSLYYLLNLSTVQSYFTPFEVFTSHFAFLPWMLLSTINFFEHRNKKSALVLAITLVISTPASYVPTLFLVFIATALITSLFYFRKPRSYFNSLFKFLGIVILINSFWLLPFAFFTLTSSSTNVTAKINQMATEGIYFQNKEFGHLWDVALLKGFWFNNIEPNVSGTYTYMLDPWRNHIDKPIITFVGYLIFGIIIAGVIYAIKTRKKEGLIACAILLFSVTMLATASPPFSWFNDFLRNHVPLFGQIFRFPFTKFSILASLSFAILLSLGLIYLTSFTKKFAGRLNIPIILSSVALMIIFVWPLFKGNLFYQKEKVKIPNEYLQTFEFFKHQDSNTRIANFPQYTFWGWNFYNWGYSGSGFLWYGINQPILDRAFDVWSKDNENYYWEMNHALYSKNSALFESVLNKYDVGWLMIDKNLTSPTSPKSLFSAELNDLIKQIPSISKDRTFGNIEIYHISLKNKPNKFVSSIASLSSANSYAWSNYDQEYLGEGDYFVNNGKSNPQEYFPFRSLFTGKSQKEISFRVKDSNDSLNFEADLPEYDKPVNLKLPSPITQNNTLPINLIVQKNGSNIEIIFDLRTPDVYIKQGKSTKKIWSSSFNKSIFSISSNNSFPLNININGVSNFEIDNLADKQKTIGTTSFTVDQNNFIVLSDSKGKEIDSVVISGNDLKELFLQDESLISFNKIKPKTTLVLKIPKLNDKYSSFTINPAEKIANKESLIVNCDNFRKDYFSYFIREEEQEKLLELSSKNATPCISFYLPTLDHDQAYFLSFTSRNIEGRGLHFWALNEDEKTPLIDTYLEKNSREITPTIVLPPMEKFGKSYSLHFDNISIGNEKSGNLLGNISINPIPFYFISNLSLEKENTSLSTFDQTKISVKHPNESLYLVNLKAKQNSAISLSQAYSPYWKAYGVKDFGLFNQIFPFFGTEIKNHVEIDNWKSGWIIDQSIINNQLSIVIVYLPQYLQYFGFILTIGTVIAFLVSWLRRHKEI